MITRRFANCTILARPELGLVTTCERRGDMAVVHTEDGFVFICSVREHPQRGAVELPSDTEPEGAA